MRIPYYLVLVVVIGCAPAPVDIEYHTDECVFCKMKISDPNFGAELVTTKGKVFKYDSAECLLREYVSNEPANYAFVLVTDYTQPNVLINATEATYLISEKLPSPMGGNLSAYEKESEAKRFLEQKGGALYTFNQVVRQYQDLYR